MTDRPIIFSAPMVRALLAGRKTQTRRIAKITAVMGNKVAVDHPDERLIELEPGEFRRGVCHYESTGALSGPYRLPWAVGDRLWVKETFIGARGYDALHPSQFGNKPIWFTADGEPDRKLWWHLSDRKRSPLHMPRWASRLTLTVTEVRVQRLQEISEADAVAEGIERLKSGRGFYDPTVSHAAVRFGEWTSTARQGFSRIWNHIHGPDAWAENPWVVALTFTVARGNIDGAAP